MTYKKILLAINVYENAELVINSAISFAKENKISSLEIVTVVDSVSTFAPAVVDFQYAVEKEAKAALEAIVSKITDIKVNHKMLVGNPAAEIAAYADQNECDLIVIGSHATHGLNLVLGSVANAVLHKSKCDVLTIRLSSDNENNRLAHKYKSIIIPTDLENDACLVADKAKAISKISNSNIDTIFVVPNDSVSLMTYESAKIKIALDKFAKKNGFEGNNSVVIGGVAHSIINKADENKNDLIIIGSHRRGAIGRFFLGSTANSTLHQAKVDVLVVKLK